MTQQKPDPNSIVAGTTDYKGRKYYMAGRVIGDDLEYVKTRDGTRYLLYARNGEFQFWADKKLLSFQKKYQRPQTLHGLQEYARQMKIGGPCAQCGRGPGTVELPDSSGIIGWVCDYCSTLPQVERSYA